MASPSAARITECVLRWSQGEEHALDSLIPLVYPDLRRMAAYQLKGERPEHTLQPTALVNEAYLKLAGRKWESRAHFLAVAARAMRQILVDHARRNQHRRKLKQLPLEEALVFTLGRSGEFLALDEALSRFAEADFRKARVLELRFFGGLTTEEIAGLLDISTNTVARDWDFAKAWLRREMAGGRK